jgi:hypothetical protein
MSVEQATAIMERVQAKMLAQGIPLEESNVPPAHAESYGITADGRLIHVTSAYCAVVGLSYTGIELYPQDGRPFRHNTYREIGPGGQLIPGTGGQPFIRAWVVPGQEART